MSNASDEKSTPADTETAATTEAEVSVETGGEGESAAPTAAELAALREKAAQGEAFRDRYVRSVAELENFRKRAARERQEAVQFANQGLLERLVPALDNLDMALTAVSSAQGGSVEALKTGVEMVLGQLRGILRDAGLEEINAAGQVFDPTWHEAVSQVETDAVPDGHVAQQLRKGYRLQQRLLRPATVIVARASKS